MRTLILTALLVAACDLTIEDGPNAGGFLFQPEDACYFQLDVIDAETGQELYAYDVGVPLTPRPPGQLPDPVCPGDQFETFMHPYGTYLIRLHRVDGEVIEVEVELDRFSVVFGDVVGP